MKHSYHIYLPNSHKCVVDHSLRTSKEKRNFKAKVIIKLEQVEMIIVYIYIFFL